MPRFTEPMTMADSWALYSKMIFGKDKPSEVQYRETRRAFYAGLMSMQAILINLPNNEIDMMAVMNKLHEEAVNYARDILRGEA